MGCTKTQNFVAGLNYCEHEKQALPSSKRVARTPYSHFAVNHDHEEYVYDD